MFKNATRRDSWRKHAVPWEVVILMLAWLTASQFSPATVDSIRDIYQANTIANGEAFPLTGPQLAHTVHLGPLWFYLLAIPVALFGTWGSVAFLVFALSSVKYWLAYVLGKELHSRQLGLFFALFLALPGWSTIQLVIWTHTTVLETALLLYLLCLRRAAVSSQGWMWLLTGLTYSLALHAHPTALPFILLALLAWPSLWRRWAHAVLLALGAAIPFLPYAFEQLTSGFPVLTALRAYNTNELSPGNPTDMLKLLFSIMVVGPNLAYRTALPAYLATAAIVVHWLLISATVFLGLKRLKQANATLKRLLTLGTVSLLVVIVTVIWIRARTPWHFAYAPGFVLAFIYALLASSAFGPGLKPAVRMLTGTAIITLFLVTVAGTGYKLYTNTIRFQETVVFDVKNLKGSWGKTGLEIPAIHSGIHGAFLCRQRPVVLHGPYAAMIDAHVGMEAEMACGERDQILVGGVAEQAGYRHKAGVTKAMKERIGSEPDEVVGNVYFYTPLAVSDAGRAIALAEGSDNPPRQAFTGGPADVQHLSLESEALSALLVTKPVGYVLALDVHRVTCNGAEARLAVRSNYSWLYTCPGQENPPFRWQAWYVSSAANMIDAILLPAATDTE